MFQAIAKIGCNFIDEVGFLRIADGKRFYDRTPSKNDRFLALLASPF
jgi:hypothetical protein